MNQSIRSEAAGNFMKRNSFQREIPERVFLENGPEFISKALNKWAYENKVTLDFQDRGNLQIMPLSSPSMVLSGMSV